MTDDGKKKTIPCHRFAALPMDYMSQLSPMARCVWLGMYGMADWTTWTVEAGAREIADACSVSKNTVVRFLPELVNAGTVKIQRMPQGKTPGVYLLVWPTDDKSSVPTRDAKCPQEGRKTVPTRDSQGLSVPSRVDMRPQEGQCFSVVSEKQNYSECPDPTPFDPDLDSPCHSADPEAVCREIESAVKALDPGARLSLTPVGRRDFWARFGVTPDYATDMVRWARYRPDDWKKSEDFRPREQRQAAYSLAALVAHWDALAPLYEGAKAAAGLNVPWRPKRPSDRKNERPPDQPRQPMSPELKAQYDALLKEFKSERGNLSNPRAGKPGR